ncbi:MAG: hypothetical protein SFV18_21915 [Bryobacteraceae bacterium]|nr:hypothetical protein [Bryobacteraceae bacterium]
MEPDLASLLLGRGRILRARRARPNHYPPEENLLYRDFVLVHQAAAAYLAQTHPNDPVATTWPATFHLSMPYLGYVPKPIPVVAMGDARAQWILTFDREYRPPDSWLRPGRILRRLVWWRESSQLVAPPVSEPEEPRGAIMEREWRDRAFRVRLLRAN